MNYYYKYVRHSASAQEQLHSRATQLREIEEYIKLHPILGTMTDAGEYYDNNISAGKMFRKRPAGAILLSRCRPGDHIVVARFDRICRKLMDWLWIADWCLENKVSLHIIDKKFDLSTATGRAMAQMCAVFAEWERSMSSERQRGTNEYVKHTKGIAVCLAAPIGWRRVRSHKDKNTLGHPYMKLVEFEPEREEARKLVALHEQGKGCKEIADLLNKRRTVPVRYQGKEFQRPWSRMAVVQRIKRCKEGFPAPPDCIDGHTTEQLMIAVPVQG